MHDYYKFSEADPQKTNFNVKANATNSNVEEGGDLELVCQVQHDESLSRVPQKGSIGSNKHIPRYEYCTFYHNEAVGLCYIFEQKITAWSAIEISNVKTYRKLNYKYVAFRCVTLSGHGMIGVS